MTKTRRDYFLRCLKLEISRREGLALRAREYAKNYKTASRSEDGDRAQAESLADKAEESLRLYRDLSSQLAKQPEISSRQVEPFSFVVISDQSKTHSFYLLPKHLAIKDVEIRSIESPLGKTLLGKTAGKMFSYKIDGKTFSGKIVSVE